MAKSKLNTDLDKSAKKAKKIDEDDAPLDDISLTEEPILEEGDFPSEGATEEDDNATYTMGDIQVDENEDEIDLKKAPVIEPIEEDEDGVWVDEEINMDDVDPYLDDESVDMDNLYDDDDNY